MKRSEMINKMIELTIDQAFKLKDSIDLNVDMDELLTMIEKEGMLPPPNSCKLVPHSDGTTKHSASERKWDSEDENDS